MKILKIVIVISFYVVALSLQIGYAQEVKIPTFTVDYKPAGESGERFTKGYGQCVDFVKQSRSDLLGIGEVGTAANMPTVAKEKGFEVNNLPREGSAIVMPDVKIITTGEITGHVAIVTKVEENKNGLYTLTIRDANAKNDIKYDKDGKIIQGSTVIERTVTYDTKERKVVDGILKEQSNIVFIHEKKDIYNTKQKEASEYVTQVSKDLGKDPSADEKKKYTEKLFSNAVSSEQIKSTIESLPAPQPKPTIAKSETIVKKTSEDESIKILKERVEVLKKEIKKAQTQIQSKTDAWNRVKEDFIKIGITIFNYIMKAKIPTGIDTPEGFLPQGLQASVLNTLDRDKRTGLDQKGGQQQLTPVKDMTFTQTYSGGYEKPSESPYKVAIYRNTDPGAGTRTGVYPGNFTTNYSITATSTENNTFSAYSSGTFTATMTGKVSGFQEGTLKGTGNMNMAAGTTGGTNFTFSGPIAIEPSGKVTYSTNGTFTLGNNSGTTTGTWTQNPK